MKTGNRRVANNKRAAKKTRVAKKRVPVWKLHLYVADTTPRSVLATENLHSFCDQYLPGQYRVTIIDIVKQPALAREHEILATPTLIRVFPGPERTVVGSLSDTARVARALELGDQPEKIASLLSHAGSQVGHA
jgi:circadian clock protein KaiB